MGTLVATGLDAPIRLRDALENGGHVGMLVDQHYVRGVDVTFFGRTCKANPLIAQLARHIDCPIHGTRVVRLPDRNRFRVDLTEAIEPARDAEGQIDVAGTMQVDHLGGRRLGARTSRAMALAAPPLAVTTVYVFTDAGISLPYNGRGPSPAQREGWRARSVSRESGMPVNRPSRPHFARAPSPAARAERAARVCQ